MSRRVTKSQRRELMAAWGRKGGRNRVRRMTREERQASARKAAEARWQPHKAAKAEKLAVAIRLSLARLGRGGSE